MKRILKLEPRFIYFTIILVCFWMTVNVNSAYAKWNYGIGTGISTQRYQGDLGFETAAGPITFDVDLDPSDFNDLVESAFGFAGYATQGTWMIRYSFSDLDLQDRETRVLPNDTIVYSDIEFEKTQAQVTIGYLLDLNLSFSITPYLGYRYIDHDISSDLDISPGTPSRRSRDIDKNWGDLLVGVTINVPINDEWTWLNDLNVGFIGSDGTYLVSTGLSWRFHQNWSVGFSGTYEAIDYEDHDEGNPNWYLYDVDEYTGGMNFMFHW
jgi:hypothetical protein